MKKILPALIVFFISQQIFSQCHVTGSAPQDTIVCGQSVLLSAYGQGQGNAIFSENFNTGTYGPGWSSTQQAMFNNPCGPNTVDGTTYVWMGNSSPVPRILTTTAFNLSSCTNAGVTICFDMRYSIQGDASPCEGPDLPAEGVYLQYSIDNGATWVTINYQDPNGGNDPQLTNWNNYCHQVPVAALTANVKFRWYQDNDSGADYDHWGIDNVVIYCNDPTYNIVWQQDNYSLGPSGGTDPNAVAPHTTTSYYVVMSNGTTTCRDTVKLVVRNPTLQLNAGNDTSVCTGQCAQLHATAKVIVSPAKTPTYTDAEQATISGAPGFPGFPPLIPATPGVADLSMSVSVTGLNQTTIQTGSITSVCIGSLTMIAFGGVDIFDIWLICPSGDSILLVKDSTISGNNLTNTCFVPAGGNITSGTSPYSGSYSPNQPFSGLNGCSANGQWTLHFHAVYYGFTLPTGFFNSWSISFNDPEISYTGNFSWNPTTNMTNSTALNPTVCPPPTAYTLTVSDTAGCVTQNDVINVTTHACCSLSATVTKVQPTCGGNNGSINVTPVPAGSYSYAWSDGPSTLQNRTGLGAGTYTVTITSTVTPTCTFDTTITLNSNSTLSVTFSNQVNPTCAGNDGSITVTLAGGTAPYSVTIDTGGTPFTINLPFAISQSIPGLHAGAISVSVTDASACTASANASLVAPVNCCSFTMNANLTQPTCGQSNGGIALTPVNGSGNYTYQWGGGQSTSSITNQPAATYTVTVTDNGFVNCTIDTSFTLNSNSTLTVTFGNQVNPTCAGNDGSITVTLGGGTAPYNATIDTGGTPFSLVIPIAGSQNIPGLHAGVVSISVTDAGSCTATANATLVAPVNCCTFIVNANLTQPACAQTNGSIALTMTNGSGNYSYNWSGGQITSSITGVGAGSYNVTITDNAYANCFIDTTFALNSNSTLSVTVTNLVNPTCANNDGSITINLSGGTAPYNVSVDTGGGTPIMFISPIAISQAVPALHAGSYVVSVTDVNGCQSSANASLTLPAICCTIQASATVIPPSCGLNNASVMVNVTTAGVPPYTYSIDGVNFQSQNIFNSVSSGNYNAIARDVNACADTVAVVVPSSTNSLNVVAATTNITCFGANDGTVTLNVAGGNIPYSYVWNNTLTTSLLQNLSAGNYLVTVTDASGCTGTASASVTEPAALTINIGNDITVCEGSPVSLTAPNGFPSYLWSTAAAMQSIIPLVTGVYSVTVTDNNNCTASDAVNVNFVPTPLVDLGEDKLVYEGEYVGIFTGINSGNVTGGTYNWMPDTLLSCANCQNTVALAVDTITYVLVYTDSYGCSASDNITLNVLPVGEVFWPNAFTPNGDGNNDIFLPYGSGVKQIIWQMFNRWGEKVFESSNFFYGCDGTYQGKPLPMGVYVYTAKVVLMNNTDRKYKGSVTLIR